MKRPEGFDERTERPAAADAPGAPRPSRPRRSRHPQSEAETQTKTGAATETEPERADASESGDRLSTLTGAAGRRLGAGLTSVAGRFRGLGAADDELEPPEPEEVVDERRAARARAMETAKEARLARRRRRAMERAEVRRFTRRSRHRRAAWITTGAVVLVLVASVLVAVYSPLLALTRIEVRGTSRVDKAQVLQAVDAQLGTPLARVDLAEIGRQLGTFPLIQSYVTEEAPPHTLVITVTERQPIVAVQTSTGYELVDPAGIVVESTPDKPTGLPVADIAASKLGSTAYRSMTEVVLSLPSTIRSTVTAVTASTADDVTLTLSSGAQVVWGSPDASARKAALLAALVKDHDAREPTVAVEYDVSAPDNGIIRTQ